MPKISDAKHRLATTQDACDFACREFQQAMQQVRRSHRLLYETQKAFDDAMEALNAAREELKTAEAEAETSAPAADAAQMAQMRSRLC